MTAALVVTSSVRPKLVGETIRARKKIEVIREHCLQARKKV
jgi:hypothetical protein